MRVPAFSFGIGNAGAVGKRADSGNLLRRTNRASTCKSDWAALHDRTQPKNPHPAKTKKFAEKVKKFRATPSLSAYIE